MFPNQMVYDSNIDSRMYSAVNADTHHDFTTFEADGFISCIKKCIKQNMTFP